MPELAIDIGVYLVILIALMILGLPGGPSALISGVAFAIVVWRYVQR